MINDGKTQWRLLVQEESDDESITMITDGSHALKWCVFPRKTLLFCSVHPDILPQNIFLRNH
jgi:hypothetical protein